MSATPPAPVLNDIPAPGNTFVLPDHKMLFVSVTKNACTSLRWMVADLAGENHEAFWSAPAAHQTRLMTIHRPRTRWQHAPQLFQIPVEDRVDMSRDLGWLIFAVVRDPWSRLWSAWQSKFLVRHSYYLKHYGDEPWFPRIPESQKGVLEDWQRFVEAAPWISDERMHPDVHFSSQAFSVQPGGINYSRIYDMHRLSELFADIHDHLRGLGLDRELYLPRANENPLPMIPEVLQDGVAERIEELYADDFEAFGDRWSLDTVRYKAESWSHDAIDHALYHTVANERIGDLSGSAMRYHRNMTASRERVAELEEELAEIREAEARRPAARARRLAGRLVRQVRREP